MSFLMVYVISADSGCKEFTESLLSAITPWIVIKVWCHQSNTQVYCSLGQSNV